MEHRVGLKKKEKPKSTAIFDVLNDIKNTKNGNLFDVENSSYEKEFNVMFALRCLSMDENLCPIINSINHIQDSYDKKQMYQLLIELIPKTQSYNKFIKTHQEHVENEKDVAEYYQCSLKEARDYIKLMGANWAEEIHKSFGGLQ
jgi:hypothetical protein